MRRRDLPMALVADRFLTLDDRAGEALDLATGERARLFVDAYASAADVWARAALCDRLAALRHPLLLPLLDYGTCGTRWFEAHAPAPPLRLSRAQLRRWVLHLVRFLREAGVELTAQSTARHIRTAIDGAAAAGRPLGVFLRGRSAIDVIRTVLESSGRPGTTAIDLHGNEGAGLRTARWHLARIARLAGYVVLDARTELSPSIVAPGRHLCVFDWLPRDRRMPAVLGVASAGARRHVWIRFGREAAGSTTTIRLEPMMNDRLAEAIFADREFGPTRAEIRQAARYAKGWPGIAIDALAGRRGGKGAGWVHETAPEYGTPTSQGSPSTQSAAAGVGRLMRAVDAARALAARGRHARAARVLTRCAPALAARGAVAAAAAASCDLGELWLLRGQPSRAARAFEQARGWGVEPDVSVRALTGAGRALLEQAHLAEAEGMLRTAMAAAGATGSAANVRHWLARTLWHRGQLDAAQAAAGDASSALLSRILLSRGYVEAAAHAAHRALLDAAPDDHEVATDARLASVYVQAALGDAAGVRHHAAAAVRAARRARNPALRLIADADTMGCLEDCGVAPSSAARERLLRASLRLAPLAAARVRVAVHRPHEGDAALVPVRRTDHDLIARFEALADAVHDTPDEASALQVIAADLLRTLDACSVVIRSARLDQAVAGAGRAWPDEAALARPVLNGAHVVVRDGLTPEAASPVRASGAVIGSIAVRWVTGANPSWDRVRDVLRVTAIAAAPVIRALKIVATNGDGPFPDELFGTSETADGIRAAIRRAAAAPYPVLVEGESGSGKELVARAVHARSARRARRLCAVNCAALTEDLLEAELFGHSRGAFTGAAAERAGLFEDADQGTLFLDEVGELSPRGQAKLLRVLQDGEVRRVGENLARRVDVRVVAATNRSLEADVDAGRFRADLRFRLDVIRITIPPLRERAADVRSLAERLWADAAARMGSHAVLGDDLMAALTRYDWPGNVRELQNVLASLAVHGPRRGRLPAALLPARIAHEAARETLGFDEARMEFERRYVRAALARAAGRRSLAAVDLGVSRQGLTKIMKRLGIE
jgi:transcriptional regulator with AAA-type ATPase domain/tetratricopeptide (TPR) repeat protein